MSKNKNKSFEFIKAVNNNQLNIVNLLINSIDINAKDDLGNTALHYAVKNGNSSLIKQLIDKGAKTDIANNVGNLPLTALVIDIINDNYNLDQFKDTIKFLIDNGANTDDIDALYELYYNNNANIEKLNNITNYINSINTNKIDNNSALIDQQKYIQINNELMQSQLISIESEKPSNIIQSNPPLLLPQAISDTLENKTSDPNFKLYHDLINQDKQILNKFDEPTKHSSSLFTHTSLNDTLQCSIDYYVQAIEDFGFEENEKKSFAKTYACLEAITNTNINRDDFIAIVARVPDKIVSEVIWLRNIILGYWKGFDNTLGGYKVLVSKDITEDEIIAYIKFHTVSEIKKVMDNLKSQFGDEEYNNAKEYLYKTPVKDEQIAKIIDFKEKSKVEAMGFSKDEHSSEELSNYIEIIRQKTTDVSRLMQTSNLLIAKEKLLEISIELEKKPLNDKLLEIRLDILNNLGLAYLRLADNNQAIKTFNDALLLVPNDSYNNNILKNKAHILNNLGVLNSNQNNLIEALSYHKKALEIREIIYVKQKLKTIDIAASYNNLANAYITLGDTMQAKQWCLKELNLKVELYKGKFTPDLFNTYLKYAEILSNDINTIKDAHNYYLKSIEISNSHSIFHNYLGLLALSNYYNLIKKPGKVSETIEKIMNITNNIKGNTHEIANYYNELSIFCLKYNQPGFAIINAKRAIKLLENTQDKELIILKSNIYNLLGNIYLVHGNKNECLECYKLALEIKTKQYSMSHCEIAIAYNNLAVACQRFNMLDDAVKEFKSAINMQNEYINQLILEKKDINKKTSCDFILFYRNLGNAYKLKADLIKIRGKKYEQIIKSRDQFSFYNLAIANYASSIAREQKFNVIIDPSQQMVSEISLALIYNKLSKNDISIKFWHKAIEKFDKYYGNGNANIECLDTIRHFGQFLMIIHNFTLAKDVFYNSLKRLEGKENHSIYQKFNMIFFKFLGAAQLCLGEIESRDNLGKASALAVKISDKNEINVIDELISAFNKFKNSIDKFISCKSNGDHKNALKYLKKAKDIAIADDSLENEFNKLSFTPFKNNNPKGL